MGACPAGAIESTWHKTGQKIKRRCFIDDGDMLPARITAPDTDLSVSSRKPIFLGILMIIAGAGNLYSAHWNNL